MSKSSVFYDGVLVFIKNFSQNLVKKHEHLSFLKKEEREVGLVCCGVGEPVGGDVLVPGGQC